jgi:hypothetical protein
MSLGKQHIKPLGIIGTLGGAAALAVFGKYKCHQTADENVTTCK